MTDTTEVSDQGGQAFPTHPNLYSSADQANAQGMALRDWFAGQALTGLCGNPGGPYQANSLSGWGIVNCGTGNVAEECYRIADAMLAARKGGAK